MIQMEQVTLTCPLCEKPLEVFTQEALLPHQTAKEYAHCLNSTCPHFYDTQRRTYYEALLKAKEAQS